MARREPGSASVEEHPKGSGRYRVRARIDGKMRTLGAGLTQAEATERADAYAIIRDEKIVREGISIDLFGQSALDRRELRRVRGIKQERTRWSTYVSQKPFGHLPVTSLRRVDIIDWRDSLKSKTGKPLAFQTKKNALNLLRAVLDDALDRELLKTNPARDVRIPKGQDLTEEEDLAGVLRPEEQVRLLDALPEKARPIALFAMLTGLRLSEQWHLKWTDIDGDFLVVRRSVGSKATKGRKPRRIRLSEPAKEILAALPRKSAWVFPATRGGRRHYGKHPLGWDAAVKACNFGRRVRWHDLRHTCATSLLAGWWGRVWTLEEVRGYMGHSSIKVTERYARILDETVTAAVLGSFPVSSQSTEGQDDGAAVYPWRRGPDSNRRVTVLQSGAETNASAALPPTEFPEGNGSSQGDAPPGDAEEPDSIVEARGLLVVPKLALYWAATDLLVAANGNARRRSA
jgi:integrase